MDIPGQHLPIGVVSRYLIYCTQHVSGITFTKYRSRGGLASRILKSSIFSHDMIYQVYSGPSCLWSYGIWIHNYLCNQCLSPLMLWVWISIRARCTTLCDKVCQWLATGQWFSPGPPISSTNKTDCHDIIEILFIVVINTNKQTNQVCSLNLCNRIEIIKRKLGFNIFFSYIVTTRLNGVGNHKQL